MKKLFGENFILTIFFLTIIFVIVVLILGTQAPTPSPKVQPVPQANYRPTPSPRTLEQNILSTNIHGQTFRVIDSVIFNFAQSQATSSVSIKIDPPDSFIVKQLGPTSISLEPEQVWRFKTNYSLTVSVAGKSYNYTFQTEERRGI